VGNVVRRALATGLLAALALAGCLHAPSDACSTCAQPTDETPVVPTQKPDIPPPDLNDSGYLMTEPWHAGDGWDYESNASNYHTVRVLQEADAGGRRMVLVEETEGAVGASKPDVRYRSWIDGDTLQRFNLSYVGGSLRLVYDPPDPSLRYLHNGSWQFNETQLLAGSPSGVYVERANVVFARPYYESVSLIWGAVTAGHVEQRIVRSAPDGTNTFTLLVHRPYRDYGNDAEYDAADGEHFQLVAFRYGDLSRGTLQPT
jgi:hypothetical protein